MCCLYWVYFLRSFFISQVAHKMADSAEQLLRQKLPKNVEIYIDRVKEHPEKAVGNGSGIV